MDKRILNIVDNLEKDKLDITLLEELAKISNSPNRFLTYLFEKGEFSLVKELIKLYEYEQGKEHITRYFFDPISEGLDDAIANCEKLSLEEKQKFLNLIYEIDFEKANKIKIKHVRARQLCDGEIASKKDIVHYFELPNIKAGKNLCEKNIQTIENDTGNCYEDTIGKNASKDDLRPTFIGIKYKSLSEDNKFVAEKLINEGLAEYDEKRNIIKIKVQTSLEDSVKDVSDKMLHIANFFHKQELLKTEYTFEELRLKIWDEFPEYFDIYDDFSDIETMIEFAENETYYYSLKYDPERELFIEYQKSYDGESK